MKIDFNLPSSPVSGERSRGLVLRDIVGEQPCSATAMPNAAMPNGGPMARKLFGHAARCARWPAVSHFPAFVFATRVLPCIMTPRLPQWSVPVTWHAM